MTRELVYTGFMSLDGVVDSPGSTAEGHRSGGWVMETEFVPEAFALKGEELEETSALMFGRRSYEAFAPVSPAIPTTMRRTRISRNTWCRRPSPMRTWSTVGVRPRSCDPAATSPVFKQSEGGAILIHGGTPELARRLSDADLIDRYNLLVFPLVLEHGKSWPAATVTRVGYGSTSRIATRTVS